MLKRKNDRQPPQRLEEERYPNDYWLDEEDGGEDIPEPADSSKPVSGRLHRSIGKTERGTPTKQEADPQGKEGFEKGTEI